MQALENHEYLIHEFLLETQIDIVLYDDPVISPDPGPELGYWVMPASPEDVGWKSAKTGGTLVR